MVHSQDPMSQSPGAGGRYLQPLPQAAPPHPHLQQPLTANRQLVEQLDAESVYDYLIQNGVLQHEDVQGVRKEKSAVKVNLALLEGIDAKGKVASGLFVNALRQSGQLHLANLLDDSTRLKKLSGSGFLSKSRHKGQVTVKLLVQAVKLLPGSFPATAAVSTSDWILPDDLRDHITALLNDTPRVVPPRAAAQAPQVEDHVEQDGEEGRKSSCLCGCFAKLFATNKKEKKKNKKVNSAKDGRKNTHGTRKDTKSSLPVKPSEKYTVSNLDNVTDPSGDVTGEILNGETQTGKPDGPSTAIDSHLIMPSESSARARESSARHTEIANLRNLTDTVYQKMDEFYELVQSPSSAAHTDLVKHFEQDRGVLVLDTACGEDGLLVLTVCMGLSQLQALRREHAAGGLTEALEALLLTEQLLAEVGVGGLRLDTAMSADDLEQAEQDLSR